MSSRVAKPGGSKFRPVRPQPKKAAHPAAVAAASASTASPAPSPAPAPTPSAIATASTELESQTAPYSADHAGDSGFPSSQDVPDLSFTQDTAFSNTQPFSTQGSAFDNESPPPINKTATKGNSFSLGSLAALESSQTSRALTPSDPSAAPTPKPPAKQVKKAPAKAAQKPASTAVAPAAPALERPPSPSPAPSNASVDTASRQPRRSVSRSASPAKATKEARAARTRSVSRSASPVKATRRTSVSVSDPPAAEAPTLEKASQEAQQPTPALALPESAVLAAQARKQQAPAATQNEAPAPEVISAIKAQLATAEPQSTTKSVGTSSLPNNAGGGDHDIPVPDLDFPLDPTLLEEEEPASPKRRASLRRRSTSNLPLGPFDRAEGQDEDSDEEMRDDATFLPPLPKQPQYASQSQSGYDDDSSDLSDIPVEWETEQSVPAETAPSAKPARKRKSSAIATGTVGRKRKQPTDVAIEPVEPWIINKKKSSYSVSTRDILGAMELDVPEHPGFTTAQEIPMSERRSRRSRATSSLAPGATPALSEEGDIAVPDLDEAAGSLVQGANEDDEEQVEQEEEAEEEEDEEHTIHDDPTIPLDPTLVLMKSLVQDTGRGRMSNYMIQKLESKNDKKKAMKMRRERMKMQVALERQGMAPEAIKKRLERLEAGHGSESEDEGDDEQAAASGQRMIEATPQAEEEQEEEAEPEEDQEERQGSQAEGQEEEAQEEEEGADEDGFVESNYAPQVKFVDGQFVIDEENLQIEQANVHEGYATVEDQPRERKVNSFTYSNRKRTARWTLEDTELFYDGLRQFGTDFEMISHMFLGRTRRQIKLKWVKEEKINPDRITEALSRKSKKEVDVEYYERMTQLDLTSGVTPADPMSRFYEGLPSGANAVKLESNRPVSEEPEVTKVDKAESQMPEGEENEDDGTDDEVAEALRQVDEGEGEAQEEQEEGEEEQEEGDQTVRKALFQPASDDEEEGVAEGDEEEAIEGSFEEVTSQAQQPEEEPFDFAAMGGIALKTSR